MTSNPIHTQAMQAKQAMQLLHEALLMLLRFALWVSGTTLGVSLNAWGALTLLLLISPSNVWGYLALLFTVMVMGSIGGLAIGTGQALALRRWLNGPAAAGSMLSTVLASSIALSAGTAVGWWLHALRTTGGDPGDTGAVLAALIVYGCVFGLIQSPMVAYMTRRSWLWIVANAAASLLGALTLLLVFRLSGERRDMLQFRYVGLAYSLVVGIAFLAMTRIARKEMSGARSASIELAHVPGPVGMAARDLRLAAPHMNVATSQKIPPAAPYRQAHHGASDSEHTTNSSEDGEIIEGTYHVLP